MLSAFFFFLKTRLCIFLAKKSLIFGNRVSCSHHANGENAVLDDQVNVRAVLISDLDDGKPTEKDRTNISSNLRPRKERNRNLHAIGTECS